MMHGLNSLENNAEERGKRGRFWLPLSIAWFIVLTGPVTNLFVEGLPAWRIAVALAGLAAFIAIYFFMLVTNLLNRDPSLPLRTGRWKVIAALIAIAVGLTLGYGAPWMLIFVFVNSAAGVYLPPEHAVRIIGPISVVAVAAGYLSHGNAATLIGNGLTVLTVGLLMWSFTNVIIAYRELRLAREGLAKLAVAEERLRFARDLHDLLGHNLSVIALKSELAGRIAAGAPERAIQEINDIEAVARTSLHDIREAVAGYRQPTIDVELRGAREVLSAAGIALDHQIDAALPDETTGPFAWAIREGVTNVVRHSRGHRCSIRLNELNGSVSLEIRDDGEPREAATESGSGLVGLRERFAAIGGTVVAGPIPTGGFRMTATAPAGKRRTAAAL